MVLESRMAGLDDSGVKDDAFGTASKEGEPCYHVNALNVSQAQFG
jgi:hypothetical protein